MSKLHIEEIEKDVFGRRICDVNCPAHREEYCDARMDYSGRMTDDSKLQVLCMIPTSYKLCEV